MDIKKYMIKEFSAGIIVFRSNNKKREYLLLHYTAGHWDFPKGHIEKGEDKQTAALRELQEETTLTANLLDGFEESITYFHKLPNNELAFKTVYFFIGKASDGEVKLSHEHIGFAWLTYENALQQLTYDNSKQVLEKAEMFLKSK